MTRADPRTVRTLTRLHRAADELLLHKAAGDISVTELCRTAGVHRTTFYSHYDTVAEVVTEVLRQRLVNLLPVGGHDGASDLAALGRTMRGELVEMLAAVARHREEVRLLGLAAGPGHAVVMERLVQWVTDVHGAMARFGAGPPVEREVTDRMVAASLAAAVAHWAQLAPAGGREGAGSVERLPGAVRAEPLPDAAEYLTIVLAALPAWWQGTLVTDQEPVPPADGAARAGGRHPG